MQRAAFANVACWTSLRFSTEYPCHIQTDSVRLRLASVFLLTGFLMTHRTDLARGRDLVARWCVLAEQRLEYLTELFETGRWRRYHSELAFLENIQEAKSAVETWRDLLTREASLDNGAIDISWLGRSGVILPPRSAAARDQADDVPLRQAEISVEPPLHVASIAPEPEPVLADEAPAAPDRDALDETVALTLDMVAIQERYPLLRNAL